MRIDKVGDWLCDIHEDILGYSLTKDVMMAYIWLFIFALVVAFFTGGK